MVLVLHSCSLLKHVGAFVANAGAKGISRSLPRRTDNTASSRLYAKNIKEWKVLPSGALTGERDGVVITTSPLAEPEKAANGAVVVTASGSKYRLTGEPLPGSKVFPKKSLSSVKKPTPPKTKPNIGSSAKDKVDDTVLFALTTASIGFLTVLVPGMDFYVQQLALVAYILGVLLATGGLVSKTLK